MNQEPKNKTTQTIEMLSRGEAIKKIGGYAALTALGTFMILNPQKAQAQSIAPPGGGGGFTCDDGDLNTCCPTCYDGDPSTPCPTSECAALPLNANGDCSSGTPCPPGGGDPFQGNGNTTNKIDFNPKYNTKYKLKYSKK
tara:strand:- start:1019 stop:1438 length:420 start_codon:yes stop_codon:yes gene_type:complete